MESLAEFLRVLRGSGRAVLTHAYVGIQLGVLAGVRFCGHSAGHAIDTLDGLCGMVGMVIPGLPDAGDSMAVYLGVVCSVDRFFDRHFGDMTWL